MQVAIGSRLLTRPSIIWMFALVFVAYGVFRFAISGYAAHRLSAEGHPGSQSLLLFGIAWLAPCLVGGVALIKTKRWSRYVVYLVTLAALWGVTNLVWQSWGPERRGFDGLAVSTGVIAVLLLSAGSACVHLYFRAPVSAPPRPPRWWIGFYVLAGIWVGLLPVFAANAHHFGPGFFPLMASLLSIPFVTVVLAADLVIRMADVVTGGETPFFRRCWAAIVSGALFVFYAAALYLSSGGRA